MKKTRDWRDGRLVIRRPEARNSVVAKSCLELSAEQLSAMSATLADTVRRCRAMTDAEREEELRQIAEAARKRGWL